MRIKHQFKIRDATTDRQPEIYSTLGREDFQRIEGQTNNDCRVQIRILTNSPTPATFVCLLENKIQDRGMYLFTISYGSYAVDQRSGDD